MSKNIVLVCITAIIITLMVQIPQIIREIRLPENIMSVTGYLTEKQRMILAQEIVGIRR